jgi:osmotically-inducible protein OsmY
MKSFLVIPAIATVLVCTSLTSCSVFRGQQGFGSYVGDSAVTAEIKSRFVGNTHINAASITVETMNSIVVLTGFAKNTTEKHAAERIAREVDGVRDVKNQIVVQP